MAAANRRCFIDWLARLLIGPLSLPLDIGSEVVPLVLNKVVTADIGAGSDAVFCKAHANSAIRQRADLLVHLIPKFGLALPAAVLPCRECW